MSQCGAQTLYLYPRMGPAPGNMTIRCEKESGHAGVHYRTLPDGGIAWPTPPPVSKLRTPQAVNIIPLAADTKPCSACGQRVAHLTTGGRCYLLDQAVHGLTERFDTRGMVVAYDHLPVWPAHRCETSA